MSRRRWRRAWRRCGRAVCRVQACAAFLSSLGRVDGESVWGRAGRGECEAALRGGDMVEADDEVIVGEPVLWYAFRPLDGGDGIWAEEFVPCEE